MSKECVTILGAQLCNSTWKLHEQQGRLRSPRPPLGPAGKRVVLSGWAVASVGSLGSGVKATGSQRTQARRTRAAMAMPTQDAHFLIGLFFAIELYEFLIYFEY